MNRLFLILVIAVILAAVAYFAYNYQPITDSGSAVQRAGESKPAASTAEKSRSASFSEKDLQQLVSYLDPAQRQQVLSQPDLLQQVVQQELSRLALYDAAVAAGMNKNNKIKYLMDRQAQDFLLNSFVEDRLQAAGLPSGFPSEAQMKTYYETHPEAFNQGERLPVWQIFWAIDEGMTAAEIDTMTDRAKRLARDIQTGKARFFEVANEHSQHEASRIQAGFMGVLPVDTLRGDIKDQLLALKINRTSSPIRSGEGLHIFRRGAVIPAQKIAFEGVRDHIKNQLTQQFIAQQKTVLSQLASSQFQAKITPEQVENWRQKQLQNTK